MIIRTSKIVHADTLETMYESTCTIDGNTVTGCINPIPYMKRKMGKLNVKPVRMETVDGSVTLYVK